MLVCSELAHGVADRPGKRSATVVELPLLGDVLDIERIGVGLILMGRAVAEHNDVPALTDCGNPFGL